MIFSVLVITWSIEVTLVGTTILFRPEPLKAYLPIEMTDL